MLNPWKQIQMLNKTTNLVHVTHFYISLSFLVRVRNGLFQRGFPQNIRMCFLFPKSKPLYIITLGLYKSQSFPLCKCGAINSIEISQNRAQ